MVKGEWPDQGEGTYKYPEMRAEIVLALEALSDPEYQISQWGKIDSARPNYFDDLDVEINILFDDTEILPDPEPGVPNLVRESEVATLRVLGARMLEIMNDIAGSPTATYLADPRWPSVIAAAREALAACRMPTRLSKGDISVGMQ